MQVWLEESLLWDNGEDDQQNAHRKSLKLGKGKRKHWTHILLFPKWERYSHTALVVSARQISRERIFQLEKKITMAAVFEGMLMKDETK